MSHGCMAALIAALLINTSIAAAQFEPPALTEVSLRLDTGSLTNRTAQRSVIFSDIITIPGAATIRLFFNELNLGQATGDTLDTVLRLTALQDGAQQIIDKKTIAQWGLTSAWFNGDTLLIELLADPQAAPSRVRLSHATAAMTTTDDPRSICGNADDRLPTTDPRIGRVISNGCTAWLINDAQKCLLTAGHCTGVGFDVIEFNYPLSNSQGIWQHAHPDDQYIIDASSLQFVNGGTGNDWGYFGCFANPATGLSPFDAQGNAFVLAAVAPPIDGRTIRITGNGVTDISVPLEYYRALKTHTGILNANIGTTLSYAIDTTGGNSGSPIIDDTTGEAIGIHTHGGCITGGGTNKGTVITNAGLLNALANPLGVCAPPQPTIQFTVTGGAPTLLDPDGEMIVVQITAINGGALSAGSAMFHLDTGDGFNATPMWPLGSGFFSATVPALPCSANTSFYFSASLDGVRKGMSTVTNPLTAPAEVHSANIAEFLTTALFDNGELDLGWTVINVLPLDGGAWQRGVPAGGGDRGDPRTDYDFSGSCWLTENENGDSDVDGGPTRLLSPPIDLSGFNDPMLTYARWFYSDSPGRGLGFDFLVVELSDDGGQSWQQIDIVTQPTQWVQRKYRIADFVALTSDVRVRFSAMDDAQPSIVECGIDAIHIFDIECNQPLTGDINLDGSVDVFDLLLILESWGSCAAPCPPSCAADITNAAGTGTDCTVNAFDLLLMLSNWGA